MGRSPVEPDWPTDYVALAVVIRPHGLKGEVRVHLTCDGLERLLGAGPLHLVRGGSVEGTVTLLRSFPHTEGDIVLRLKEVEGRDAAERLRGAYLAVKEQESAPLEPGRYRRHEILGFAVETPDGRPLGTLEDLMEMPAHPVLVVRQEGRELLLPAHPSMVREVDSRTRRIVVDYRGDLLADETP